MSADPLTLALFLPLFGAMAGFVFPRAASVIGLGAVLANGAAVVWLALKVADAGAIGVHLGGWAPPLGIALRADGLSTAMLAMTAGVGLMVSLGALDALREARQRQYFWPLWLLLLTGMNGVYLGSDLFNLYVMIEVIALAAVGLTVLSGTRAALGAGLEYMYASILGALLFLMGVGLVYLQIGRLDFTGLVAAEPAGTLSAAMALMLVGLALKSALFPLHFWLPAAHANATAPASALLSGLVVKAALYLFLRLTGAMPLPDEIMLTLIGGFGAGAVLWGGVQALRAERLKLLVAWSTVVQIGLMFIALASAGPLGLHESWKPAAILIMAHGVAKAGMFLAAGRIRAEIGHDRIADLDRAATRPALAQFAFALAAVSIIGLPPSLGFIGKWSLMEGALAAGNWHWVAVTMTGTLLAVAYFSRVFAAFLRFDRMQGAAQEHPRRALADLAPLTLALAAVSLGLMAAPILSFIDLGYPPGGAP